MHRKCANNCFQFPAFIMEFLAIAMDPWLCPCMSRYWWSEIHWAYKLHIERQLSHCLNPNSCYKKNWCKPKFQLYKGLVNRKENTKPCCVVHWLNKSAWMPSVEWAASKGESYICILTHSPNLCNLMLFVHENDRKARKAGLQLRNAVFPWGPKLLIIIMQRIPV